MRTYKIELRADFQDESKYDLLLEMARASARELLGTALMLKDKRDPQMRLEMGDMFSKDENVEIIAPEDARGE